MTNREKLKGMLWGIKKQASNCLAVEMGDRNIINRPTPQWISITHTGKRTEYSGDIRHLNWRAFYAGRCTSTSFGIDL